MAEPKTKRTNASADDFIAAVPNERRRADARTLVNLMREVTGEEPAMWGPSIIGFGTYRYKYASGREGDWPVAAFSPRKQSLVVYIASGFERYEDLMSKLGRHKTGVACLYLNRLSDVDLSVLKELIAESVRHTVDAESCLACHAARERRLSRSQQS